MKMGARIAICLSIAVSLSGLHAQATLDSTALRTSGAVTLSAAGPPSSPLWLLADSAGGPAAFANHVFGVGLTPALVVIESPVPFDGSGALVANFSLDASVLSGTPLWMQLVTIDPAGAGDGITLSNTVHRVVHPRALTALGSGGFVSGVAGTHLGDDEVATVPLGMTFQYYGVDFTSVHVDSNGLISFGSAVASDPMASAAGLAARSASLAVLWADLDPSVLMGAGDPRNRIHIDAESGACCRLTWKQVQRPGSAAESTASVCFWNDGSIVMEWGAVGGPVTVGMNALGGTGIALVDISASANGSIPAYVGFVEHFATAGAFDLSGSLLTLRPDGAGGYSSRIN